MMMMRLTAGLVQHRLEFAESEEGGTEGLLPESESEVKQGD